MTKLILTADFKLMLSANQNVFQLSIFWCNYRNLSKGYDVPCQTDQRVYPS